MYTLPFGAALALSANKECYYRCSLGGYFGIHRKQYVPVSLGRERASSDAITISIVSTNAVTIKIFGLDSCELDV